MADLPAINSYTKHQPQKKSKNAADGSFSVQGDAGSRQQQKKGANRSSPSYHLSISREAIEASKAYREQQENQ